MRDYNTLRFVAWATLLLPPAFEYAFGWLSLDFGALVQCALTLLCTTLVLEKLERW